VRREGFWNLPNSLTVLRIFMVPVMVWMLWTEPTFKQGIVACAIFVGAMITDIIDGWLARRWDLVSPIGAYLDPLADKLMTVTVLVMLIPLGRAPAWIVVVLLCRELAITGLRGIASQEGLVISASALGKLKTVYMATAIGFLLWHHPTFPAPYTTDAHSAGIALLYIATFCSMYSGAHYFIQFVKHTRIKL
jgi:CDP-diacylglycerol--glycerol-3-phosphate 3-phosphatidyltransferase